MCVTLVLAVALGGCGTSGDLKDGRDGRVGTRRTAAHSAQALVPAFALRVYATDADRYQAAGADVNDDGVDDVVLGSDGLGRRPGVRVRLGSRHGALRPSIASTRWPPLSGLIYWDDLHPVELNGDGHVDLVAISGDPEGDGTANPVAALGDGRGHFRVTFTPGGPRRYPRMSVTTLDFNRDGRLDLVATGDWPRGLRFFRGVGGGRFVRAAIPIPASLSVDDAVVADVDGDGNADVVADQAGKPFVLRSEAPGQFRVVALPAPPSGGFPAAAADLDGDGRDEVLARDGEERLYVLRYGSPAVTRVASTTLDSYGIVVRIADVTGDRRPDVVASTDDELVVIAQTDGGFAPPVFLPGVGWTAIGDFNADERTDIASVTELPQLYVYSGSALGASTRRLTGTVVRSAGRRTCVSFRVAPAPRRADSGWSVLFGAAKRSLSHLDKAFCATQPAGTHIAYLLRHGRTVATFSVKIP